MKIMKVEEIPLFVQDVVDLGIEICAIGQRGYCLDDSELPEELQLAVQHELQRVVSNYGYRAHLKFQINAYLRSIDRYLDEDGNDVWREPK